MHLAASLLLVTAHVLSAVQTAPSKDAQPAAPGSSSSAVYVPQRVFDTQRRTFTDFETMVADLSHVDVTLIGEQHDNPNTHGLEAAVLQGLLRRKVPVTVSLEMFERDVQSSVDAYLHGTLSEDEFLKGARPWPRYATDYRSLVELAKVQKWPVVAANVPRKYASQVAKGGLGTLDTLGTQERESAARELRCPLDGYFDRFAENMQRHPDPSASKLSPADQRATTERYYQAQCVKDETMAESIAAVLDRQDHRGVVVHFTGSFHSDFGTGTTERLRRRLPGRRITVVSMVPVEDLDNLMPSEEDLKRAEYLVYTLK
jgi:uncharacterized iron-regulated protein